MATLTETLAQLLSHPSLKPTKTATDVDARLLGMGIHGVCSRCAGSGSYGPRCVEGGRCFKCRGTGKQALKHTRVLVQRVREVVERGELDTYAAKRVEIARAKRAVKGLHDQTRALYPQTAWYRHFYEGGHEGGWLRHGIHDACLQVAEERALSLAIPVENGRGTDAMALALIDACAELRLAYERMDKVHTLALARGLYEVSADEIRRYKTAAVFGFNSYEEEREAMKCGREIAEELLAEVIAAEAAQVAA